VSLANRSKWIIVSAALSATVVGAADPLLSLAELPVAAMSLVAPEKYTTASDFAARGGTPLDIALKIAGELEGSSQYIIQLNDRGEAPSKSRITIVRDGLLDDSIRGERWDVALDRTSAGLWSIREVKRAWRCRRAAPPDRFATAPCP